MNAAALLVLLAAAAAVYTDVTAHRIPNALVLVVLAAGLAIRGTSGLLALLIGIALFAGVLLAGAVPFSLRIIGGGDVKFLAAASAALGWPQSAELLVATLLAGGLLAVAVSVARGRAKETFARVGAMSHALIYGLKPLPPAGDALKMPYAVAIFVGAAYVAIGTYLPLHVRLPL